MKAPIVKQVTFKDDKVEEKVESVKSSKKSSVKSVKKEKKIVEVVKEPSFKIKKAKTSRVNEESLKAEINLDINEELGNIANHDMIFQSIFVDREGIIRIRPKSDARPSDKQLMMMMHP